MLKEKTFKNDERGRHARPKKAHAELMHFITFNEEKKRKEGKKNIKQMPWQEALGNVIAKAVNTLKGSDSSPSYSDKKHSIINYLGSELLSNLFNINIPSDKLQSICSGGSPLNKQKSALAELSIATKSAHGPSSPTVAKNDNVELRP